MCVACTAGVHEAGQRPWERPDPRPRLESLVTVAPAGIHQPDRGEERSSFNLALLLYFSSHVLSHPPFASTFMKSFMK